MTYAQLAVFFVTIFVLGAAMGSFLGVVVLRLFQKKTLRGRSCCPHCDRVLKARDLVPIISFLLQKGQCRYCTKRIFFLYPSVELSLGLIFVYVALIHVLRSEDQAISFIVRDWYIGWILVCIFVFDFLYMHVEDRILVPAIATVFIVSGIFGWHSWANMLLGALVAGGFFAVQYVVSRGKWIGSGDILIGVFMGVVLAWPVVLVGLFFAYLIGALFSVAFVLFLGKNMDEQIPMGVYLAPATFMAMFWGDAIMAWYVTFL